jgi:hypothetical protein
LIRITGTTDQAELVASTVADSSAARWTAGPCTLSRAARSSAFAPCYRGLLPAIDKIHGGVIAGTFARQPLDVVLHGSQSGLERSTLAEFESTARYAVNEPDGYSWNVTIGDDAIAVHMAGKQWAGIRAAAAVLSVGGVCPGHDQ